MRKLFIVFLLLLIPSLSFATLTVGKIPKVKTGGSSPAIQDSIISESGTVITVSGTIAATNVSGTNTGDQTSVTGNAGTATALAANGTNCNAGNFPLGVDASGASESCTALPTTITGTSNQITASASTGAITLSIPNSPTLPGTTSGTFSGNLTGNVTGTASSATALAANGSNCSAGSFPLGVDASGASETCTALPTTITGTANQITASASTGAITLSIPSSPTLPGTTTGTFSGNLTGTASLATALGANGTNCSAGNYPLGVDASGNAESCTSAAGGAATNVAYSGITNPTADTAIVFSTFGNVWTSSTTAIDSFKINNSGNFTANKGVLNLSQSGNPTGGAMLLITDTDSDTNLIQHTNFTVSQAGAVTATSFVGNASTATALAANGANCSAGSYPLGVDASGAVEGCTVAGTGGSATSLAYDKLTSPTTNSGINFGSLTNVWTSSNSGTFFTIDGSADTIFKGNGDVTIGGDLTVAGDDIFMATNTSGMLLIADGTNYNPTAMSGDVTINSSGATVVQANAVALGTDTTGGYASSGSEGGPADSALAISYNGITSATGNAGISFGAFNNTWTATSGSNIWTSTATTGDYFTVADTGVRTSGNIVKIAAPSQTGGAMLAFNNVWTSTFNVIDADGFKVDGQGKTTIGRSSDKSLIQFGGQYTADPCNGLPATPTSEGTLFWNSTNHYLCQCINGNVGRKMDGTTSCF